VEGMRKLSYKQENERLKNLLEIERDIRIEAEKREIALKAQTERLADLLKLLETEDEVYLKALKITHPKLLEVAIHILTTNGFRRFGGEKKDWYVKYPEAMKVHNGKVENFDVVIKGTQKEGSLVKIKKVESHGITFEDGSYITYDHDAEC